ncbi:hypothetical protein KY338_03105 [Candidatus Woesearchaeota archaeon]|nr:hypothetical protein [Candidatus Woesearchaeota archaeon]MBW3005659.1 hypothetical protein [Candidatus Woesearchaeota archaeon]
MEEKEKTKQEIEKEEKEAAKMRKIAAIAVVGIIVIFFIALFGVKYFYSDKVEYPTVTYNGFEFTEIADTWYTQWQNEEKLVSVSARYNPYEVENVTVLGELNEGFHQSEIYVTFDPYSEQEEFKYLALAAADLSQSIEKAFSKEVIPACTQEHNETCNNVSIVSCKDTDKAVIHIIAKEPTQIVLKGNCIELHGKELELIKSVDKLLYLWYKIITPN